MPRSRPTRSAVAVNAAPTPCLRCFLGHVAEEDPGHAAGGDHRSGPDHPSLQHRGQAGDVRDVLAPRLDARHPGLWWSTDESVF